jgi:hypothetical protein
MNIHGIIIQHLIRNVDKVNTRCPYNILKETESHYKNVPSWQ